MSPRDSRHHLEALLGVTLGWGGVLLALGGAGVLLYVLQCMGETHSNGSPTMGPAPRAARAKRDQFCFRDT